MRTLTRDSRRRKTSAATMTIVEAPAHPTTTASSGPTGAYIQASRRAVTRTRPRTRRRPRSSRAWRPCQARWPLAPPARPRAYRARSRRRLPRTGRPARACAPRTSRLPAGSHRRCYAGDAESRRRSRGRTRRSSRQARARRAGRAGQRTPRPRPRARSTRCLSTGSDCRRRQASGPSATSRGKGTILNVDIAFIAFTCWRGCRFASADRRLPSRLYFSAAGCSCPSATTHAGTAAAGFPFWITGIAVPSDMLLTKAWIAPAGRAARAPSSSITPRCVGRARVDRSADRGVVRLAAACRHAARVGAGRCRPRPAGWLSSLYLCGVLGAAVDARPDLLRNPPGTAVPGQRRWRHPRSPACRSA